MASKRTAAHILLFYSFVFAVEGEHSSRQQPAVAKVNKCETKAIDLEWKFGRRNWKTRIEFP